jgi:hypothetical protein
MSNSPYKEETVSGCGVDGGEATADDGAGGCVTEVIYRRGSHTSSNSSDDLAEPQTMHGTTSNGQFQIAEIGTTHVVSPHPLTDMMIC